MYIKLLFRNYISTTCEITMQASLDRVIKFLKTVTPGPILEPQEETNIEHRSIYGNVEITKLQM